MLIFEIDPMKPFFDAMSIMYRFNSIANFECSPKMFSIVTYKDSHNYPCIVALQIVPQFFTQFQCDRFHCANISIIDFYVDMLMKQRDGFSSFTFFFAEHQDHVVLKFHSSSKEDLVAAIGVCGPSGVEKVGEIDYSAFVSIDLEEFKRLVSELNTERALVTLSSLQIKFSVKNKEVILTVKKGQCVIGGVGPRRRIKFIIALYPMEFYNNFTSKRLWLFKSKEAHGTILVAPIGLYAWISSYFPSRL